MQDLVTKNLEKSYDQIHPIKFERRKIILSILLSLLLGTIIGFIFLSMFTNIGGDQPKPLPPVVTEKDSPKEDNHHEDVKLKQLSAYVLQAGLFSDERNAKKAQKVLEKENLPSILWFKDSQYYIFLGVTSTKEDGDTLKEDLIPETIEVYVKEWSVPSKTINASSEDAKFLKDFSMFWKESVKDPSSIESWEQLFKQGNNLSVTKSFFKQLKEQYEILEGEKNLQLFLLISWQLYETFINSLDDKS